MGRRRPPAPPNSRVEEPADLKEVARADVFGINAAAGQTAVLSVVGSAAACCTLRALESETAGELVKAVERAWIRLFGPMGDLRVEAGSCFASELRSWQSSVAMRSHVRPYRTQPHGLASQPHVPSTPPAWPRRNESPMRLKIRNCLKSPPDPRHRSNQLRKAASGKLLYF